ncbi:probable WRKY transcription factor 27 [Vitis riparia]|uniref:probable WRKY transcription factor 27 n=1 Tax=Vitis riparia TaxID=96939 RepID=UPI00155AF986|nr:probable WRKY transcription factor 27 [Vitis riparia]
MSNDWDLSAIVRSCSSSAGHKVIARNTLEESFLHPDEFAIDLSPPPFPVLIDPKNELDDPFDELSHVYKPFYRRVQPTTAAAAAIVATPVAADSTIGGSEKKRRRKEVQQRTNAATPIVDAPAIPINAAVQPEAPQQQQQNENDGVGSQAPRGRRRKQPRLVIKMSAESLSTDSWSWRKYGQKPIQGSITPRSYYRCSSFKGCAARKQVDLSEEEPDVYIVTYIGDHTHRRPGGWRSDVGTTEKVSASPTSDNTPKPDTEDNNEDTEPWCEAPEDDDDTVMAMHALDSTGSASTSSQPQSPPKNSVSTAGESV